MKAHKYWSIGALITMICTFLTGHMNKMVHNKFYPVFMRFFRGLKHYETLN